MKNFKLLPVLAILFSFVFVTSCVPDDDYDTPDTSITEPELNGELVSISSVKTAYDQAVAGGEDQSFTFTETNTFMSGFVISSDEGGNFFEELIVQDASENATAGIKVLLDVGDLFTRYETGRRVYVKLDGLSVGMDSGVITLGILEGSDIEKIPAPLEEEYVLRSSLVEAIVPNIKTLSQISEADTNTLINLASAQFTESQLGTSFAGEVGDEFDGDRTIESCAADGGDILFQTSTFADFKSNTLPSGAGSLTAVLSKDFFGENFTLSVRTLSDIVFDGERCEPTLLDPNITATTTFSAVIDRYNQAGGFAEFSLDEAELIIEGYVVSSDQEGNYFEELVIQNTIDGNDNSANDPRLGFRVAIDRGDLYQTLPVGRKVYIKLNGLAVDEDAGNITIGYPNVSEIEKIPDGVADMFVFPGEVIADIIPKLTTVNAFTSNDLNTLIQLENMQFTANDLGLTFSGEDTDGFDGERSLESCDNTGDIRLFTSSFAEFKSLILPSGVGNMTAIYTNNFFGDERILELRTNEDLQFINPERCDPPIVDCGNAAAEGPNVLFAENFETQSVNSPITDNGMTNYQEAGTQPWEAYTDTGANASIGISARVGSFNSGDDSTVTWLAFPEIDYDAQDGETLRFMTSNSFSDGSELEILFSSDWDGVDSNIPNATWAILPAALIVPDDAFFGDFIDSGIVDLSCVEGTGYIAFKYIGSGVAEFDGTYELDEIEIRSN